MLVSSSIHLQPAHHVLPTRIRNRVMDFQCINGDENGDSGQANTDEMPQDEPQAKRRRVSGKDEPSGPSCCSCRKRKAKCSRDQPCTSCVKLGADCVYDHEKMKPGMRQGAIESLNQRLATLENMFVGQGMLWQQIWNSLNQQSGRDSGCSPSSHQAASFQQQSYQVKDHLQRLSSSNSAPYVDILAGKSVSDGVSRTPDSSSSYYQATRISHQDSRSALPASDLVDSLVEIYFHKVHPWIPMLHVQRFRACLSSPSERARVSTILHAIVSLCVRFSDDPRLHGHVRSQYALRCRQTVILESIDSFSVENLQALIICAFDTIGGGRGPSAWSIVGSMTRTVEHLRLSTEEDDDQFHSSTSRALIKRVAFLPPASTWSEAEERRRVSWNVFLMDRFCSISTGWNLSLTSADVHRRLPCEGAIWEAGEPAEVPTPYFGIANQWQKHDKDYLPVARESEDDQTSLGGFAYCIEATESLALVTSFFLQYEVDFRQVNDVQRWLMRFKQLDLRLVQWKFFLPQGWQEACLVNIDGNLDPNLVLAHITHNTAVVLLHQGLAYPPPDWQSLPVRLPSASSSETCQAAAVEVAAIAAQFLAHSPVLTSPQFAFCLFVCGKMLLTHAAYYQTPLHSSYDSIVASLDDMTCRWSGTLQPASANLASKFSSRLKKARLNGADAADIREAFSDKENTASPSGTMCANLDGKSLESLGPVTGSNQPVPFQNSQTESPESISLAFPPLPLSFQMDNAPRDSISALASENVNSTDEAHVSNLDVPSNFLDFCDLSEHTFLPSERVAMLSRSYPGS
ncbi:Zn(II)2Cys6 transcriptional activator [Fusarium albosuccineum]|uniref:Zn(II)2Cys6 transcriptional activator n=1 Tax=Fusarium albosuccineum TaxID=1237068 RepID=A0A8H4P6W1_9HYPO|nr:Zn(II)2Cys6 transcriptional activator [Fusarium albosuccineum]